MVEQLYHEQVKSLPAVERLELVQLIVSDLLAAEPTDAMVKPEQRRREALLKEEQAYCDMHADLASRFMGRFVAIFRAELVDLDSNIESLLYRVRQAYGSAPVLIRQVQTTCREVYAVRSPRLVLVNG